jgi:predicted dehydrogenase
VTEADVVLQTGSHERSNPGAAIAKQVIGEGRLGKVRKVHIQLPAADAHLQEVANMTTPPPNSDTPPGLDYNFWLGPAPVKPYNPKRCHFWWRFHRDYGGGEMTDRGCHVIDLAHMIMGLDGTGPVKVSAKGQRPKNNFYDTFSTFEFTDTYADGLVMTGNNEGERGAMFEGTEGKLFIKVHGGELVADPVSLLDGISIAAPQHHAAHRRNFIDAIRNGTPVIAPVEAGHRTATVCHLNNIAMLLERDLEWDPVAEKTNDEEANGMLMRGMRAPWEV